MVALCDPLEPYFQILMCIGMIPCGFVFLITWRIARRFGGRGLAVTAFVAAVLGPVRDHRLYGNVPGSGAPTRRDGSGVCHFGGVCHLGSPGTRIDASDRRPFCGGNPSGVLAVGTGTVLRRLKRVSSLASVVRYSVAAVWKVSH